MKTADLVDAHGDAVRFCNLPFIKLGKRKLFSGPIHTVKCFEDNALLKAELQKTGHGRVMIVDGGGSTRFALLGDQIALILKENGWAGIVINGSVRDSAEIDLMDVGVFCLATTPRKSSKDGAGKAGIKVSFGGVDFLPGEFAYADHDGLLVSDPDYTAPCVLTNAQRTL
ncbi:ribonuclease E activity regulator RraA [Allorhizobium undicola]|uniref:ribonuclease E activity regulator RraA n=1 Tax=Allorhizobium undicola TaxID=78527 RepID=UPI003D3507F6